MKKYYFADNKNKYSHVSYCKLLFLVSRIINFVYRTIKSFIVHLLEYNYTIGYRLM